MIEPDAWVRLLDKSADDPSLERLVFWFGPPQILNVVGHQYRAFRPQGFCVFFARGHVESVHFFCRGAEQFASYREPLPFGINIASSRGDLQAKFGVPVVSDDTSDLYELATCRLHVEFDRIGHALARVTLIALPPMRSAAAAVSPLSWGAGAGMVEAEVVDSALPAEHWLTLLDRPHAAKEFGAQSQSLGSGGQSDGTLLIAEHGVRLLVADAKPVEIEFVKLAEGREPALPHQLTFGQARSAVHSALGPPAKQLGAVDWYNRPGYAMQIVYADDRLSELKVISQIALAGALADRYRLFLAPRDAEAIAAELAAASPGHLDGLLDELERAGFSAAALPALVGVLERFPMVMPGALEQSLERVVQAALRIPDHERAALESIERVPSLFGMRLVRRSLETGQHGLDGQTVARVLSAIIDNPAAANSVKKEARETLALLSAKTGA